MVLSQKTDLLEGLIKLVVIWRHDVRLMNLLKSDIANSLEPYRLEVEELIQLESDVLPEAYTVSKKKFDEIQQFDYYKGLMEISKKSKDEVKKTIKSFFEINLYESDSIDFR